MPDQIDAYIAAQQKWQPELKLLRKILLATHLDEQIKWGAPCYSYKKKNVVILGTLKSGCVLGFFKGSQLSDTAKLLQKPGANTQSARTLLFNSTKDIEAHHESIQLYLEEAIELEKAGATMQFPAREQELELAAELINRFKKDPALKSAFLALTPGRQRAYNLFFTGAKQSSTRDARIDKYAPKIRMGKGMHDY